MSSFLQLQNSLDIRQTKDLNVSQKKSELEQANILYEPLYHL
jgi:hypothetical protein